jgi:hypothetical protein
MMIYVAYHDVCINNFQKVQQHLGSLSEILPHVKPALMVVVNPDRELSCRTNFKGPGNASDRSDFRTFLSRYQAQGGLIFQHGLTHFAHDNYRRNLVGRWVNSKVSKEAEFAGLSREDCRALVEQIRLAWDSLQLVQADGFVAPTWHGPRFLKHIIGQCGLRFFESRSIIHDFQKAKVHKTPSLSLWGDDSDQFASSLRWNLRYYRLNRLLFQDVKLALHPSDFAVDRPQQVLRFIRNLAPPEKFSSYPT